MLTETKYYINNKIESPSYEVLGAKETDAEDKPLSANGTATQSALS